MHFLIQSVSKYSPSEIIRIVKSITARRVFAEHPEVKKINNLAYAELNKEIENHYNHAETPTVTREEIDKKTREAAIRLGYVTE